MGKFLKEFIRAHTLAEKLHSKGGWVTTYEGFFSGARVGARTIRQSKAFKNRL